MLTNDGIQFFLPGTIVAGDGAAAQSRDAGSGRPNLGSPGGAEIRAVGAGLVRLGSFDPYSFTAALALRTICVAVFGTQVMSAGDLAIMEPRLTVNDISQQELSVLCDHLKDGPVDNERVN